MSFLYHAIVLACISLVYSSCSSKNNAQGIKKTKGSYFSIQQYARDQFSMNKGIPYGFHKISNVNGKKDTVVQNFNTVDWPTVFKLFFETDISDKKFLGHYNFSQFDDSATQSRNYYYEAKEDYLETRKLLISTDPTNNKVVSIYIEYEKKGLFKSENRKLFYIPLKVIQIQQFKKALWQDPVNIVTEYEFM